MKMAALTSTGREDFSFAEWKASFDTDHLDENKLTGQRSSALERLGLGVTCERDEIWLVASVHDVIWLTDGSREPGTERIALRDRVVADADLNVVQLEICGTETDNQLFRALLIWISNYKFDHKISTLDFIFSSNLNQFQQFADFISNFLWNERIFTKIHALLEQYQLSFIHASVNESRAWNFSLMTSQILTFND